MRKRQTIRWGLIALPLLGGTLSSGCATNSQYSCEGYPDGDYCQSVREVYKGEGAEVAEEHTRKVGQAQEQWAGTMETGAPRPIRTPAQVMRVWHAPMEDQRGVLHMATYSFVEVETRRWSVGEPHTPDAGAGRMMRLDPDDAPDTTEEEAPGTRDPNAAREDVQQQIESELTQSRGR